MRNPGGIDGEGEMDLEIGSSGGLFYAKAGRGAHTGTDIARSHEHTVIENQYLHSRGWEYASRILHPATIEIFRAAADLRFPSLPR